MSTFWRASCRRSREMHQLPEARMQCDTMRCDAIMLTPGDLNHLAKQQKRSYSLLTTPSSSILFSRNKQTIKQHSNRLRFTTVNKHCLDTQTQSSSQLLSLPEIKPYYVSTTCRANQLNILTPTRKIILETYCMQQPWGLSKHFESKRLFLLFTFEIVYYIFY